MHTQGQAKTACSWHPKRNRTPEAETIAAVHVRVDRFLSQSAGNIIAYWDQNQ